MRLRLLAPLMVLWVMLALPIQPAFAAMDYAKQVLIGADFSNREMQGVTFNLTNAVLEDAFAFNTRFINVTVEGADFTNVPLRADALKVLCANAEGVNPVTGRDTRETLGCS